MNSVHSKLENKEIDHLYHKNTVKSIAFLLGLGGLLLVTILLSLRSRAVLRPISIGTTTPTMWTTEGRRRASL